MRDEFHEPQFRADSDGDVVRCPYCKYEYQPDGEDYSEDTRTEECSECGKKYHLYQSFSVDHHVKPDCELNGEAHQWDAVENGSPWQSCDVCDKWQRLPAEGKSSVNSNEGKS